VPEVAQGLSPPPPHRGTNCPRSGVAQPDRPPPPHTVGGRHPPSGTGGGLPPPPRGAPWRQPGRPGPPMPDGRRTHRTTRRNGSHRGRLSEGQIVPVRVRHDDMTHAVAVDRKSTRLNSS